MIVGVGTDLIEIARIEAVFDRRGDAFARRILWPGELLKFESRMARARSRGIAFLATRFAAKEAFSKAIGLGIRSPMSWRAMELLNAPSGRPVVMTHGELARWMAERSWIAHASVTDERSMAGAFVVVETAAPAPNV